MELSAIRPAKLNILVADDDPIFRSLVEGRLLHLDCQLHEAADGAEAWRIIRTHKCDLALVDFEMPGLDGIALTRCLRSHPLTQHIPIVMCTSRTDGPAMQAALEAGVSSFMTKPLNWSLFERHLAHLLHLSDASARGAAALDILSSAHNEKDALVTRLATVLSPLLQRASLDQDFKPITAEAVALLSAYQQVTRHIQAASAGEPKAGATNVPAHG